MTGTELARDVEWQRLDPRMLLVHPIRELLRFLPVIIVVALGSTATGGDRWQLLGVAIPVGLGVLRYLTTSFRINGGRIELQRGLLSRHVLSTPVDRVRTVDLTSSPIHRLLGLTTVRIGTGSASTSDEDRIDLDGLPVARARELRAELLRVSTADDEDVAVARPDAVVVAFDRAWLRFAPLTGSGIVIGAAALGAGSQLLQTLGLWERFDPSQVDAPGVPLAVLVPLLVLTGLVLVSVLAVGGYAVTNWAFRLTRDRAAATWHLTRGLFTTRETTIDDDRLAGVIVSEPLGLRLGGGARLSAIVTGLSRNQQGSSTLVPPAPRVLVDRVAGEVLDTPLPVSAPLVPHGAAAARRRWTRALVPALVLAAGSVAAVALAAPAWVLLGLLALPGAALLALDRVRTLGHTLVAGYLVSRSGSLVRNRRVLEVDHVIGWNFRSTWFQRRAGLTTLVATTAGGSQAVPVLDVPEDVAVRLAHDALPDLVAQFRA